MWQRFCFVITLIALPLASQAQLGTFQSFTESAQEPAITLEPSFPSPGKPFTATIQDYSGGLFGSEILWRYNGALVDEATNQRAADLVAGAAGERATIEATVRTAQGDVRTITQSLTPIYIDIIIEPQTRVPDWYWGRSLPSFTSQINATALLHNGSDFLNSNEVVYTWTIGQETIENGPIRGGNKVSFETPRGNDPVLVVSAADLRGNTLARRAVRMTSVQPELAFYEKHSLYGMRTKPTQSNTSIVGNIITLQAEPFNLDTRVYNNPDVAQWEINSVTTDNGVPNPYEITLSRAGTGGRTGINFHVRSLEQILQGAEDNVVMNF